MNPDDLEQLASLLDGRDAASLRNRTDAAFRKAATLGVTPTLAGLRPLTTWATDTAPDLRRRAARVRMTNGDLAGGFLWAGFTPRELAQYRGTTAFTPESLLLANSVAASEDPRARTFHRRPDESLDDWLTRLQSQALTSLPALHPFEPAVEYLLSTYGDWLSATNAAGRVIFHGTALTKVLVGNSFKRGWGARWKGWAASSLQRSSVGWVEGRGDWLAEWDPKIRSLSAPGSWMPSRLTASLVRIPGTGGMIADRTGDVWNVLRSQSFMDVPLLGNITVNRAIDFVAGSDRLAAQFGGLSHAGTEVIRAGSASLYKVTRNAFEAARTGDEAEGISAASRSASLLRGLTVASKVAGAFRGVGIVSGVASTAFSSANLVSDGNPIKAYKRKGTSYVADVADVGFNASLTSAMIAPNPVSFGFVIATGTIYGTAEVVQHWGDIPKAAHWVDHTASDIAGEAKSVAKKLNPFDW
ncbi:PE-PGRS family protein [Streptomyces sp. NPDC051976]|uniref:PE-PGRS family protein n=1 Tax=Streptomyces sp. NPDC051976 TaxID=3154947 RepID=UPI003428723F